MKISYTTGCTCTSYDIDGKEFIDLPLEEQRDICDKLLTKAKKLQYGALEVHIMEEGDWTDIDKEKFTGYYTTHIGGLLVQDFELGSCVSLLLVDGSDFIKMDVKEKKKVYRKMIKETTSICALQSLFEEILRDNGTPYYLGYCEECGDHIEKWEIEL